MTGRFVYSMIAGAAVVGGMYLQGDLKADLPDRADIEVAQAVLSGDAREIDRKVDRIIDREIDEGAIEHGDERAALDPTAKRELSRAVAELVRAEGSLITAKLDDDMPPAAVSQAQQRRELARQAVDRLSRDASAASRGDRDALRENIRAAVRDAVRS